MQEILSAIARQAFQRLFVEILHWDRVEEGHVAEAPHDVIGLMAIARACNITVLVAEVPTAILEDRGELRRIQRKIQANYPEHLLIIQSEKSRRQVWLAAVIGVEGRSVRHKLGKFESAAPSTRLISQLSKLTISADSKRRSGSTASHAQIRTALHPVPGCRLLFSDPGRTAESDRLALAVKRGEAGSYPALLEFHRSLIWRTFRRVSRILQIDLEDSQQIVLLGILEALQNFEPNRGYCFEYFAAVSIFRSSDDIGLRTKLPIRVPHNLYWKCDRLAETYATIVAAHGEKDADKYFEARRLAANVSRETWEHFCAVREPLHLTDLSPEERSRLRSLPIVETTDNPDLDIYHSAIENALRCLKTQHAEVLRRRYGMGTSPQTLSQVAKAFRVTKQCVQHIQLVAEWKLRRAMRKLNPKLCDEFRPNKQIATNADEVVSV